MDGRTFRGSRILVALAVVTGLALAVPAFAGTPYQARIDFEITATHTSDCVALSVPSGTRLTVEFVSVLVEATATGQVMSGVILYTQLSGQSEVFNIVPVTPLNSAGSSFQGAQTLKAYADVGTSPRICVSRSPDHTTGDLDIYGSVNGTLDAI